MSKAIRILIADDHPIIRSALKTMIKYQPGMEVVAEAVDGEDAVRLFFEHLPDITLLDLSMPKMSGFEVLNAIRARQPEARIIVLTNMDSDEDIFQSINAGAMSYLLKDTTEDKLLTTILAVHAGQRYLPPHIRARLEEHKHQPTLSARELEVLSLVKEGLDNLSIARKLMIAESTVKSHLKSILIKLGAADRTQAVTIAIQLGILRL